MKLPDDQAPAYRPLSCGVLVMVLRRELPLGFSHHFMAASFAPIEARLRGDAAGDIQLVKSRILTLVEELSVLVKRHDLLSFQFSFEAHSAG